MDPAVAQSPFATNVAILYRHEGTMRHCGGTGRERLRERMAVTRAASVLVGAGFAVALAALALAADRRPPVNPRRAAAALVVSLHPQKVRARGCTFAASQVV